jgi:hypothetical protein
LKEKTPSLLDTFDVAKGGRHQAAILKEKTSSLLDAYDVAKCDVISQPY